MRITGRMKIKDVLAIDEEKMLKIFFLLAPEFERLRYPKLRQIGRAHV